MLPPISWTDRHRTQASGLVWLAKLARPRVPRIGLQPELPVCGRWLFPGKPRQVSRAEAAGLRSRDAKPAGPQARQYSATGSRRGDLGGAPSQAGRASARSGRRRDQSGNSRAAAERNAVTEGVHDQVELADADARDLPSAPTSFDLVVAGLSGHHIPLVAATPALAHAPTAAGLLRRSLIGPGQGAGLAGGDGACQDPEGGPQRTLRDHREDGRVLPALLGC